MRMICAAVNAMTESEHLRFSEAIDRHFPQF